MGPEEIRKLLQREKDAWNAHDPDGVAACFAEDAELVDAGMPEPMRGRAALRAFASGYVTAFPDLRLETREPTIGGNLVAQKWTATGTHTGDLRGLPATGRKMVTQGCLTVEIGDCGLLRRGVNNWDATALMRQLGLLSERRGTTNV